MDRPYEFGWWSRSCESWAAAVGPVYGRREGSLESDRDRESGWKKWVAQWRL